MASRESSKDLDFLGSYDDVLLTEFGFQRSSKILPPGLIQALDHHFNDDNFI